MLLTRQYGGFNPLRLFANSEKGAWFDPSDISTLFQDTAGATPVTTIEQPVALMLDKSQGLAQQQKLTNGNWAGNTTGWTKQVANFTATATGSGTVLINGITASGVAQFWQSFATVVGRRYLVTGNIVSATNNSTFCAVRKADDGGATTNIVDLCSGTGNGPVAQTVFSFVATAATTFIVLQTNDSGTGTTTATFSTISVIDVLGNHATQATAGNRPTYRARYNLLTFSEDFTNAAWTRSGASISGDQTVAPDGTTTADLLTFDSVAASSHAIQQTAAFFVAGATYTQSVYIKQGTQQWVQLLFATAVFGANKRANFDVLNGVLGTVDAGVTASITAVGNGWFRLVATCTATATASSTMWVWAIDNSSAAWAAASTTNGSTLFLWGAQYVVGTNNTYQRIAAATSYNAVGFLPYLAFNGTSSAMATGSIDFSTTDKITAWAGVNKQTDGLQIIAETSAGSGNGRFYISNQASGKYEFALTGTTTAGFDASTFTAPVTNVLSCLFDIAGAAVATEVFPRVNAAIPTLVGVGVADAGTGNFLANALNIGARSAAATPSLFLNGNLYGLIVRGASSTAAEITSTENWLNGKTGAY